MKTTNLLLLASLLLLACNTNNKQTDLLATSSNSFEATDLCFATDSIRFCEDNTNALCANLPLDVYYLNSSDGNFQNGYSSVLSPNFQPSFDNFSWQSFVALNWPSDAMGQPVGSNMNDYPDSLRVWERFTDASKVFNTTPQALLRLQSAQPNGKVMSQISKVSSNVHASDFMEADNFPLIDRYLNFVVYEVKMNAVEAEFIANNQLNTKQGIYEYYKSKGSIELPVNTASMPGAIEIKASWRILEASQGDDLSKYYTQNATIYVASENSVDGSSFSFECTIGLVGLHILRKTEKFENWIWSTFEHIDNVPDNLQQAQTQQETTWSFYNPDCLNCPLNQAPTHVKGDTIATNQIVYRWQKTAPYASLYGTTIPGEANGQSFGTQVSRVYPIYYCTEQLNDIWQSKLASLGSVFANYKLVGSQWMVPTDGTPPPIKINAPNRLGNTTAETFMQESSSCISCHTFAGIEYIAQTKDTMNIATDFSFTFLYAQ